MSQETIRIAPQWCTTFRQVKGAGTRAIAPVRKQPTSQNDLSSPQQLDKGEDDEGGSKCQQTLIIKERLGSWSSALYGGPVNSRNRLTASCGGPTESHRKVFAKDRQPLKATVGKGLHRQWGALEFVKVRGIRFRGHTRSDSTWSRRPGQVKAWYI